MAAKKMYVEREEAGTRLDLFLKRKLAEDPVLSSLSRSEIGRLIADGEITVNGKRTKPAARLRTEDAIEVRIPPPRESPVQAEDLPLSVLFEDEDCIIINKAPRVVVHPAAGQQTGTIVNAL